MKPAKDIMEKMREDKIPLDQWELNFDRYSKIVKEPEASAVDDTPLH